MYKYMLQMSAKLGYIAECEQFVWITLSVQQLGCKLGMGQELFLFSKTPIPALGSTQAPIHWVRWVLPQG